MFDSRKLRLSEAEYLKLPDLMEDLPSTDGAVKNNGSWTATHNVIRQLFRSILQDKEKLVQLRVKKVIESKEGKDDRYGKVKKRGKQTNPGTVLYTTTDA